MTMRLAKTLRRLTLLGMPAILATCALAQQAPNVKPSTVRDQLANQTPGASKPAPASAKAPAPTVTPAPAKAQAPAKSATQAPANAKSPAPKAAAAPVKAPAKGPQETKPPAAAKAAPAPKAPAKEAAVKSAKPPAEKPAEEKVAVTRRDPFETLVNRAKASNAAPVDLPPGKAGLIVGSLRINGIVHGSSGMIAIVSNPQQRVYFLREGDKLYDGSVEHITLEAISFQETGKDAFGKPLERQVTKRLYPSPGEQQ